MYSNQYFYLNDAKGRLEKGLRSMHLSPYNKKEAVFGLIPLFLLNCVQKRLISLVVISKSLDGVSSFTLLVYFCYLLLFFQFS